MLLLQFRLDDQKWLLLLSEAHGMGVLPAGFERILRIPFLKRYPVQPPNRQGSGPGAREDFGFCRAKAFCYDPAMRSYVTRAI